MKKKPWIICAGICLSVAIAIAGFGSSKKLFAEQQVIRQYQHDITQLEREVAKLTGLVEHDRPEKELQQQFKTARAAYKKTEWMAEYYNAYTAKGINGPALPEVEPDEKDVVIEPEGFQVVEELLFPAYDIAGKEAALKECRLLQSNIGRLKTTAALLETTGEHVFDALRLEVFRIIALGITGFDSPVAQNSIPEAAASLHAIEQCYTFYGEALRRKNGPLHQQLQAIFRQAQDFLRQNSDFNSFNRMQFITEHLNPLSEHLLLAQRQLNLPVFRELRAIRAGAPTLFAKNVLNPDYFLPTINAGTTPEKIALGKILFYDNVLSGDGKRSCATCHQPQKAFSDGLTGSLLVDGGSGKRNALSLVNAALQPSFFWDNRVAFLEDQVKEVVHNKEEMAGSLERSVAGINRNERYQQQFKKAYGDTATEYAVCNAIASYIRSLTALDSRFDRYMRGDFSAMNKKEVAGFNLFAGKAKCATCHFVPLFNGVVPPACDKIDAEVLGVPATADTVHPRLDADAGKYNLFKIEIHRHAFKTPTLRNIALTAPYMHNGVYRTLEEVVDFYNRGGGAGMGLKVEHQTLPEDRLNLTEKEKEMLVSFLQALTDTGYMRHFDTK